MSDFVCILYIICTNNLVLYSFERNFVAGRDNLSNHKIESSNVCTYKNYKKNFMCYSIGR